MHLRSLKSLKSFYHYRIVFNKCLYHISFTEPDAKAVLNAAEEGDLEKIKELLNKNRLLLESTDKDGYTPLHRACYGNHVKIVEVTIFFFL